MGVKGSGRRPLPTAVKKLRGNAGQHRDRINELEPKFPVKAPEMPPDLPELAIAEWGLIVPTLLRLGVLAEIHGKALAAYCFCFARWCEAEEEVRKRGIIVEEPIVSRETGEVIGYKLKRNPAVSIGNDALKLMKSFLVEFGLTPSSLSRLKVETPKEEDPLDLYMRKKAAGRATEVN